MRTIIYFMFFFLKFIYCFSQFFPDQYIVTFKADTINRLQPNPSAYIPYQLKAYISKNFYRIELVSRNKANSLDTTKVVEIRNQDGIFTTLEISDPFINREIKNIYLLSSQQEIDSLHTVDSYSIEKIYPIKFLKIKASRIIYKDHSGSLQEGIFTTQLYIPLLSYFKSYPLSIGSPLQFIDEHDDWKTKFTAISITAASLDNSLFKLNKYSEIIPRFKN